MIDGSFYTIVGTHDTDSLHIRREIVFRMDHVIFQAHFPDNPIVPEGKVFTFDIQLVAQSETLFSAKTTISDPETIVVKASLLCEKH